MKNYILLFFLFFSPYLFAQLDGEVIVITGCKPPLQKQGSRCVCPQGMNNEGGDCKPFSLEELTDLICDLMPFVCKPFIPQPPKPPSPPDTPPTSDTPIDCDLLVIPTEEDCEKCHSNCYKESKEKFKNCFEDMKINYRSLYDSCVWKKVHPTDRDYRKRLEKCGKEEECQFIISTCMLDWYENLQPGGKMDDCREHLAQDEVCDEEYIDCYLKSTPEAIANKIQSYFDTYQPTSAEDAAYHYIFIKEYLPEKLKKIAHWYVDNNKLKDAGAALKIGTHLYPNDIDNWIDLMEIHFLKKDLENYMLCYAKAQKIALSNNDYVKLNSEFIASQISALRGLELTKP